MTQKSIATKLIATLPRTAGDRSYLGSRVAIILGVTALYTSVATSHAQISAYDFTGLNGTATADASVFDPNLDSSKTLTRGAGAVASAGANSFRTVGFKNDGISTANTDYFQFTLSAASGYTLSLSSIDAKYAGTASYYAAPGVSTQFAYSLDGTTFTLIGSPQLITATNLTSPAQISLSGIGALQNVVDTTTVTFRFYASGQTATGGFGFNSPTAGATGYGLAIGGTLTQSGGPPAFRFFDINSTSPGSGNPSGTYNFSGANWNSVFDGTGATSTFTDGQTPTFAAGTDGTGTYTVNIDTAVNANGMTFEEGNVTIGHAAGGTLTLTGASLNVASGATATISEAIGGTVGVTKDGAGTLTLSSTTSAFTGNVTINNGILSISADANLGDAANDIVLGGGTLQAAGSINFGAGRDLSGSGSISVGAGNNLTFNGAVNTTALTISNSGTVNTAGSGVATKSAGNVTFTAAGVIANSGDTLSVANITTTHTSGTATISGPVSLGAATRTVTVADGSADVDLLVSGNLSGAAVIAKLGAGTLQLTGDNSALTGGGTTPASLRIGAAAATPTNGGLVSYTTATSLGGVGSGSVVPQIQFNGGTLRNDASGPLVVAIGFSIGAQDQALTPGGAVFSGAATEFQGPVSMFAPAGTSYQHAVTVNNVTTFSGVFSGTTTSGTGGTAAGLTVAGTGTLALTGTSPNTFVEPVTVGGTATLSLGKASALGGNSALIVGSGGNAILSGDNAVNDRINDGANVTINGGGKFKTGGLSEGTRPSGASANDGVAGMNTLTLSGTASFASVIDFNSTVAGSSLVFASLDPASKGAFVNIINWGGTPMADNGTTTFDRLLLASDPGFTKTDLANYNFNGLNTGAMEIAYGNLFEIVPAAIPEPSTYMLLLGVGLLLCVRRVRIRKS